LKNSEMQLNYVRINAWNILYACMPS
jgi:hypothetical protein